MRRPISEQPLLKAKMLAVLLALADKEGSVDFKNEAISRLWELDCSTEEYLFELSEQRAIHYEAIGEDGFAPIIICSVTKSTAEHLFACLAQVDGDVRGLSTRVQSLLSHDPNKLREDIANSQRHIEDAREQLSKNPILEPLKRPLEDVARHFESIRRVAENYDDVYRNILRPVQEEGRTGIRATVRWAVIGIVASWLLSNYGVIKEIIASARGAG